MKDEKDSFHEMRMNRWKMREELLNSMDEKELRAFIKGYMMGQRTVFKHLSAVNECGSGSCGCGGKECNCGKEHE